MASAITPGTATASPATGEVRFFVRRAAVFLLIGAILYTGVYAASEKLVAQYGHRNRFFGPAQRP